MKCSCIRGEGFDFHVDAYKHGIVYQDVSDWVLDEPYQVPNSYFLDITLPEKMNPIRVHVALQGAIFREDLNVQKFPDGIYKFSLIECCGNDFEGCCGRIYTKYKYIYPELKACLHDAIARLEYNDVQKVASFFKQAEIQVELGRIKEAQKLVKKGKSALKALNCNCPCL